MNNRIEYIILKEHNLILEHYSGNIYLDDIIRLAEIESADENFNATLNIIVDFRKATLNITEKDVSEYVQYAKNKNNFEVKKTAILTSTPNHVVVSTLFSIMKDDLPIDVKICSTLSVALQHVNIHTEAETKLIKKILKKSQEN